MVKTLSEIEKECHQGVKDVNSMIEELVDLMKIYDDIEDEKFRKRIDKQVLESRKLYWKGKRNIPKYLTEVIDK